MSDELRNARRARLSGVRVTIEGATGRRHQAEVADLSKEGLFIISKTPLAIGKRLSLEIYVVGEEAVWPALGRVIWTRETGGRNGEPPGMGVKIIDIDDAAAAAVDRLVETREQTEPGLGIAEKAGPERERTMLGVGAPSEPPVPPAPIIVPSPVREATLVGVGATGAGTKEPSLPIDLVAKKSSTVPPAGTAAPAENAAEPSKANRRSGGRGFLLLAFIAGCAIAGYAARDRLMELFQSPAPTELSTATPPPPPSAASPASASATLGPTMAASLTLDASAPLDAARATAPLDAARGAFDATAAFSTASAATSAPSSAGSAKRAPAVLPSAPPPHKPKGPEEANPY